MAVAALPHQVTVTVAGSVPTSAAGAMARFPVVFATVSVYARAGCPPTAVDATAITERTAQIWLPGTVNLNDVPDAGLSGCATVRSSTQMQVATSATASTVLAAAPAVQ